MIPASIAPLAQPMQPAQHEAGVASALVKV